MPENNDEQNESEPAVRLNAGGSPASRRWLNAWTVGLTLFGFACLDVVLRLWSFHRLNALDTGWQDVVNDPGKHFFHLVMLPLVGAYLFKAYPRRELRALLAISRPFRLGALGLAVGLGVFSLFEIASHEKEDFYTRTTAPEDVRDLTVRSNLFLLREHAKTNNMPAFTSESYRTNAIAAFERFSTNCNALFQKNNLTPSWSGLITQRSMKVHVALLETLFAVWTQMAVLWSGLVFFLGLVLLKHKQTPPVESIHAFFSVLVAILLWTPIKMYSEWYAHFKVLENAAPAIGNVLVWVAVCGLVFFGWLSSTKTIKLVYSGFTLLGTAAAFFFQTKHESFEVVAVYFYNGQPFLKFSFYVAATFAAVIAMLSLWRLESLSPRQMREKDPLKTTNEGQLPPINPS